MARAQEIEARQGGNQNISVAGGTKVATRKDAAELDPDDERLAEREARTRQCRIWASPALVGFAAAEARAFTCRRRAPDEEPDFADSETPER
jgi:hypothetical protein